MAMETRYAKVFFPNYSKKKLAEDTLVPPLRGTRENVFVFLGLFVSRCCARRNLRFHVENCLHADQKQLTRRQTFDLDIEATHGQPGSCRARPVDVDGGLEDINWIRGLRGEKLPAASYALLPNLKKLYFWPSERDREFFRLFYTQQRPNVFVSDAWPAPATYHRSFCEYCEQRVSRNS